MADDVKLVRSIGVIGQGGVGKTSLADALAFAAGANNRLGRVDDDTSLFDFEPEEHRHKTSLTTSLCAMTWRKHDLTLLDTPGYASFLADSLNCVRACTGLLYVLAAAKDEIRVEGEKLWARGQELGLPTLAVVTRLDRDRADFQAALEDLQKLLGAKAVPIQYPIGSADGFRGVVDLVKRKAWLAQADGKLAEAAIPEDVKDEANLAREQMIELAAEVTDELTEKYLEAGTLSDEELVEALRLGALNRRLVPVLYASGAKGIGAGPILDAVVDYLGSAADLPAWNGVDPKIKEPIERQPQVNAPFSALVVKTVIDPFAGKLSLFRVVSGKVTADSNVVNATKDTKERLGHLFKLIGKKQQQVESAVAGEVIAVSKLKDTATGDTLADEKGPIVFEGFPQAPAAISFAIEPKSKHDDEKASLGLHKLNEEDPSLEMHRDPQTRELILSGVGQQHIEIVIERLKRKYGVEVELKAPKVPYKETIKGKAEAQGKLKKQTGGRGQFGDAWLRLEPLPRGEGFQFVDEIVGGVVPRQYIPAVEKGVREALTEGFLAGYPIVDLKVCLYDGSYHDVDSSEMAFKIAASLGLKAALAKARPILLEPVMIVEVSCPDENMGDVIGDLNGRRGKVLGVDSKPGGQVIKAHVPMSEILKYSPDLRSMTSGRGSFTMGFSHYEELPAHLADKVIKEAEAARAKAKD